MGLKLTKKEDVTRENVGLTLDDLREFCLEAERVGVDGNTVVTGTIKGWKRRVALVEVEA